MPTLVQAVRAGIYDADVETRNRAREAFLVLQSNYPNEADRLFQVIWLIFPPRLVDGETSFQTKY
jgi:hypothetical protein